MVVNQVIKAEVVINNEFDVSEYNLSRVKKLTDSIK